MNDLVVQGLVAAVVTGVIQGYYRAVDQRKNDAQKLGSNLGPRVEKLGLQVARIEGTLKLPPIADNKDV
jgi:hypothetical protein